ncbi:phage major capsid protein [Gracilimonas tropica]|uniref:phage major capsid protein n=1 Tax=Gracilimonas tropica TaxID=454600 RepID=UPI00035F82E5|nr:phage major capsid protein [Gracilimonas tropica]
MDNYERRIKAKDLREQSGVLNDKAQAIVDKAEGREMTNKETTEYNRLIAAINKKMDEAEDLERQAGIKPSEVGAVPIAPHLSAPNVNAKGIELWESASGPTKGSQIRVYNRGTSFSDDLRRQNPEEFEKFKDVTWASWIRGIINGETRLMDTSNDSQLVPTPLSASVIDLARNKSRIFQAGAKMVPMSSKTLDMARVTSDVDSEWKAEGSAWSQSDVTLDKVTLTAKTLIAGTRLTVELSEDAPNASEVIQNSIAEKLALELDRVGLVGSGSGQEPEGLFLNSNVNEVSLGTDGAVLTNYVPFSEAYQKVLEANGVPRSAIFAPRTWGELDRLVDNDNNPLRAPQSWQDLQKLVTNQVPIDQTQGTSTDASSVFIGDYSQMLVGMRTQLRLEVSRVASDANDSAWENLEIWIRGYLRADIQFAHPNHFCRVVGITPES